MPYDQNRRASQEAIDAEDAIVSLFAKVYSRSVVALTNKYGPEAFELMRRTFIDSIVEKYKIARSEDADNSLRALKVRLDSGLMAGDVLKVVEDTETNFRVKTTVCPWANHFQALGHPEIGKFICAVDEPCTTAFNENIKFENKQNLMDGDDYCEHHYYIETD